MRIGRTWMGLLVALAAITMAGSALLVQAIAGSGPAPVAWKGTQPTPWTHLTLVPLQGSGPSGNVCAAWRQGFLAIAVGTDQTTHLWRSPDGSSWTELPRPPFVHGCPTAVSGGFIVLQGAGVWWTADGAEWTRAADLPGWDGSGAVLEASGDRGVVVLERAAAKLGAWYSRDGRTWETVRLPEDAVVYDLSAGHDGFVAAGQANGVEAIWTSSDGRTWAKARLPSRHENGRIDRVTVAAGGVATMGSAGDGGPDFGWTSRDAVVWNPVEISPTEAIYPEYSDGDRILAIQRMDDSLYESTDGATWNGLGVNTSTARQDAAQSVIAIAPDGLLVTTLDGTLAFYAAR